MKHTVKTALLTGTIISAIGVVILYFLLPSGVFELHDHYENICRLNSEGFKILHKDHVVVSMYNGFARRYDGSCGGWTPSLALFHVTGDLMHWWAYTTAAAIIYQLHPIMAKVPSSRTAVYLMVAFIFGCGTTHLLEAYATFNPVYVFSGWFKIINAIISCLGAYFIAKALVRAFAEVGKYRKRLEDLEQKQ